MKLIYTFIAATLLCFWVMQEGFLICPPPEKETAERPEEPYEMLLGRQMLPDGTFDLNGYRQMMALAQRDLALRGTGPVGSDRAWEVEGPYNIGGRITTICIHPQNPNIIYIGTPNGGLYKTTDAGQHWKTIFDANATLAIAHITLNPRNPNQVWVGTGDPDISGYMFIGDGVYMSNDGGETWKRKGLQQNGIVSKLVIDPTDTSVIYAACMGIPMTRNTDRGLYKSTDGGNSWNKILYIDQQTGVTDVIMDSQNPKHIIAASWQRIRTSRESVGGGPGSGLWHSEDGGSTWNKYGTADGLMNLTWSRIGLHQHQKFPNIWYAVMIDSATYDIKSVIKSSNNGISWNQNIGLSGLGNAVGGAYKFGWYFAKITADPNDTNEILVAGVDQYRTKDGQSWSAFTPPWWTYEVHADGHVLHCTGSDSIYIATDGGIYFSADDGTTWAKLDMIPNTQMYRIALPDNMPGSYTGGAQDNGTSNGNTGVSVWPRLYGGDGFQAVYHPGFPQDVLYETQWGGVSEPLIGDWSDSDRVNWDMPLMRSRFDDHAGNYKAVYSAAHYMCMNYEDANASGYQSKQPISPDLTDGNIYGKNFHNISSIGESPLSRKVIYAGTSDGNVWVTTDEHQTWQRIGKNVLPDRYISAVRPSYKNPGAVFVSQTGYKMNDFSPHIYYSSDYGANFISVSGDLPTIAVNDVTPWFYNDSILFAATDAGVYITLNRGDQWYRMGNNMPLFSVYDIEIDTVKNVLVAGTFARGIMTYPLDSFSFYRKVQRNGVTTLRPVSSGISVFPNPAQDYIQISGGSGSCEIISLQGTYMMEATGTFISVGTLPVGVYFVRDRKTGQVCRWMKW